MRRLVRTRIGPLTDRALAPGQWRLLTLAEVRDLGQAAQLMRENAVRRLPVIDDGQIVGIVSMGDLAASGTEDHSPLAEVSKAEPNT